MGCVGYCMGGRMALAAAGTFPEVFKAAASLYGGRQVTDDAESPHRIAMRSKGAFYIAFAGQSMDVPVENIAWSGEEFSFEMNLGEILGGSIGATGTVAEDGSLKGKFEMDSEAAAASGSPVGQFLQLGEFEGSRGI